MYSLLELIGYPVISILFILAVLFGFKYLAGNTLSKGKERLIFFVLGIFPIAMFMCLIYLNRFIETPLVYFGSVGSIIVISLAILTLVLSSIWTKTWVLIFLPIIIFIPEVILDQFAMQESTKVVMDLVITVVGIGIYLFISTMVRKIRVVPANNVALTLPKIDWSIYSILIDKQIFILYNRFEVVNSV